MHFIIIIILIGYILYEQIKRFRDTKKKMSDFQDIFPEKVEEELAVVKNPVQIVLKSYLDYQEKLKEKESLGTKVSNWQNQTMKITSQYSDQDIPLWDLNKINKLSENIKKAERRLIEINNELSNWDQKTYVSTWCTIQKSINRYLKNNEGGVSDFQLIKDIVDRNCDADEEEIQTQIPVPLYLGLMGTMGGILVGLGSLWISGGIKALLSSNSASASTGITALLGGVALAMICSIAGILMTTIGSMKVKDAKARVERLKHEFLSWMQSELLPKLSQSMVSTLESMTRNLNDFNKDFSTNSSEFRAVLSDVKDATIGQSETLKAINELKVTKIAKANIEVYEKLKGCTDELGQFAEYVTSLNDYLGQMRAYTDRLVEVDDRVKMIEEMAAFFKLERSNLDTMKGLINSTIASTETHLMNVVDEFKLNASTQFEEIVRHLLDQREKIQKVIDEQDNALNSRVKELVDLTSEVKNLSSIKVSMSNLDKSTREQSAVMRSLMDSIEDLMNVQLTGERRSSSFISSLKRLPMGWKIAAGIIAALIVFAIISMIVVGIYVIFVL